MKAYHPIIISKRPLFASHPHSPPSSRFFVSFFNPVHSFFRFLEKCRHVFILTLMGDSKHCLSHDIITTTYSALTRAYFDSSFLGANVNIGSDGGKDEKRERRDGVTLVIITESCKSGRRP